MNRVLNPDEWVANAIAKRGAWRSIARDDAQNELARVRGVACQISSYTNG
jgi:hypothetical protein